MTKDRYEEIVGLSVRAQESRIQREKWRRGIEYAVVDGKTMINLEAVEARISQIALCQRVPPKDQEKNNVRKLR